MLVNGSTTNDPLSARALLVVQLLARDYAPEQIARLLRCTSAAADVTIDRAIKRLHVDTPGEAVQRALRRGLIGGRTRRSGDFGRVFLAGYTHAARLPRTRRSLSRVGQHQAHKLGDSGCHDVRLTFCQTADQRVAFAERAAT